MQEIALDSDVLVASFLDKDAHHDRAKPLIDALHKGEYRFHISTLVLVEVCGAIFRRIQSLAGAQGAKTTMEDWVAQGKMKLYDLDKIRSERACEIAMKFQLKGADAVVCEVADELGLELLSFDGEVITRFPSAIHP